MLTQSSNRLPLFTVFKQTGTIGFRFLRLLCPLLLTICSLTACSGLFDKDNTPEPTPLTNITPEIQLQRLWATKAGSGTADEYLKMTPTLSDSAIFTTSTEGVVTSINQANGRINWQIATEVPIAAGPSVGDSLIIIGSRKGNVIALQQSNGKQVWQHNVTGEILAKPSIAEHIVLIKTTDGYLRGLSTQDGHELWSFHQVEPSLILRGASTPLTHGNHIIAGFANGNLAKLTLSNGQLVWLQTIAIPEGAFAIQRMIDIDANPVLFEQHLYAATYQGKIASLDWISGQVLWSHDISSYTGMVATSQNVFVADAKSDLWAFHAETGDLKWRQNQLAARSISAPAILNQYVIVGDGLGYLHGLDQRDGHFVAREFVGSPIYATPLVQNNVVYVLTSNGYLAAYTLQSTVHKKN